MDISMPLLNGIEATRQITAQCPNVAVLVLTVHSDIEHIMSILQAGAIGYLTKGVFGDEVVSAVRSIIAGETIMTTEIFKQVIKHTIRYTTKPIVSDNDVRLTVRELEVFKLVAKGLSNKDISSQLGLTVRTIKGYMVEILSKLNASSRTEAVIIGLRKGLIITDDIDDDVT
jgi:DNA-binding NarL/FixJ family response regulator